MYFEVVYTYNLIVQLSSGYVTHIKEQCSYLLPVFATGTLQQISSVALKYIEDHKSCIIMAIFLNDFTYTNIT